MVTITPAIAGPFDLGVVAAEGPPLHRPRHRPGPRRHRSDPPDPAGHPADLRSVAASVDRPQFTLNPTSCDPKSFNGTATSARARPPRSSRRFQVGGCEALGFKPKLALRLFGATNRGAHPRLRALFTPSPGDANIAAISVTLPHSEFIDQAHFRTICTRVQFAANQCPAGSVYGHVNATSPLLGHPLEGPVYLRSSSHQLPDVVAALRGPPSPADRDRRRRPRGLGKRRPPHHASKRSPTPRSPRRSSPCRAARRASFKTRPTSASGTHRATVKLDGQNGKVHDTRPALQVKCPKAHKKNKKGAKRHRG